VTQPSAAAGSQDPAAVIAALRQTAASFRAEAARIGGALAASATASDRLCTLTVTGRGEITAVAFTPDIVMAGPSALERSVQAVYAEASQSIAAAPPAVVPVSSEATSPDVAEAAQRLASIDQWGKVGVVSAAPTPDPEVIADPAAFNDILTARVSRIFAAFDRVGPQLQSIVGHASSELSEVDAGPDGIPIAVRFTSRAIAAGPETLADDLLQVLAGAAADSVRQRDALLDDPLSGPGGRA